MEAFFRGSHTTNFVTCGFKRSYNQAAEVPSSNVTCKSPRSPAIKSRIMLAFVSITHSITIFPAPFLTAIEMLSLCTSIPIYFLLSIEGVPFCGGFEPNTQNPTHKGAPFYIVSSSRNVAFRPNSQLTIRPFIGRDAMKNNFVHSEGSRVYKRVHSGGQNRNL